MIITILNAFYFDLHDATLPSDSSITVNGVDKTDNEKEENSKEEETSKKEDKKSKSKALLKALGFDEEDEDEDEKEEEEKVEEAEDDVEGDEEEGDLENDENELKTSTQPGMDNFSKDKVFEVIVQRILPRLRQALQSTTVQCFFLL